MFCRKEFFCPKMMLGRPRLAETISDSEALAQRILRRGRSRLASFRRRRGIVPISCIHVETMSTWGLFTIGRTTGVGRAPVVRHSCDIEGYSRYRYVAYVR